MPALDVAADGRAARRREVRQRLHPVAAGLVQRGKPPERPQPRAQRQAGRQWRLDRAAPHLRRRVHRLRQLLLRRADRTRQRRGVLVLVRPVAHEAPEQLAVVGAAAIRACACASRPRQASTPSAPRSWPRTSRRSSISTAISCGRRCRRARRPATHSSPTWAPSASRGHSTPRPPRILRAGAGSSSARRPGRRMKRPARGESRRTWPRARSADRPLRPTSIS